MFALDLDGPGPDSDFRSASPESCEMHSSTDRGFLVLFRCPGWASFEKPSSADGAQLQCSSVLMMSFVSRPGVLIVSNFSRSGFLMVIDLRRSGVRMMNDFELLRTPDAGFCELFRCAGE